MKIIWELIRILGHTHYSAAACWWSTLRKYQHRCVVVLQYEDRECVRAYHRLVRRVLRPSHALGYQHLQSVPSPTAGPAPAAGTVTHTHTLILHIMPPTHTHLLSLSDSGVVRGERVSLSEVTFRSVMFKLVCTPCTAAWPARWSPAVCRSL